jgi:hypothetical protein
MKIRLTEGQYKRIFLNDIQEIDSVFINEEKNDYNPRTRENSECFYAACDRGKSMEKYGTSRCYSNSTFVPYWYTLMNPFGDGFDYQWKIWDDCSRKWIRRPITFRDEGKDLYSKHTDMSFCDGKDIFIDDCDDNLRKKLYNYKEKDSSSKRDGIEMFNEKVGSYEWRLDVFKNGNETLKAWGWDTIPDYQRDSFLKYPNWEDIQPSMINTVGYKYLRELEDYKSNLYPYSSSLGRYAYFWSIKDHYGNDSRILIRNMDAYGELKKYKDEKYRLPSNAKYPWLSYIVLGNVEFNDKMPNGNWTSEAFTKETGVNNYGNWFNVNYGTLDISKIKSMIKGASEDRKQEITRDLNSHRGGEAKRNKLKAEFGIKDKGFQESLNSFGAWIDTWDTQDWIDVASIVLYLIPTPLTWGIATGLEVLNAGISLGKGQYGDAAIRSGFLVGGFLISKWLSSSYKVSREAAEETTKLLQKLDGVTEKSAEKIIRKEYETMGKEAKQLLDDLMTRSGKKITELQDLAKKNKEFMDNIQTYMEPPYSYKENKAVRQAGIDTWGETTFQKYWVHIAPTTKTEAIIMSLLYGSMQTYSYITFKNKMIQQLGAKEEEVIAFFEGMINTTNAKTSEEVEEMLNNSLTNLNEFLQIDEEVKNIPLFNKFYHNCNQKFETIEDVDENENINEKGISVDAGGNYEYKIYPDLISKDSWVYTKKVGETQWIKGNCETAKVVFKEYCKKNAVNTDKKEGVSCFNMLDGEEWEKAMAFVKTKQIMGESTNITDDDFDKISDGVLDGLVDFEL